MIEIVIAKYNEDLSWTSNIPSEFSTFIYDKGIGGNRPNIGREAETWVYHIITHYDNLFEYTVFLQGNPFDHMKVSDWQGIEKHIRASSGSHALTAIGYGSLHCESPSVYNLPCNENYLRLFGDRGPHTPVTYNFIAGAQYMVPKALILTRSLEFYKKLYALIIADRTPHYDDAKFHHESIDPWTLERLWMYIWNRL